MPDELTDAENEYFESHGEKELPEAAEAEAAEGEEEPEAEAEAADGAEQDADAETEQPAADEEPRTVPLQALHEAREEAKRLREQIGEKDAAFNKLTGRLDVLEGMARQEQESAPDWDEAPIDAGKALGEKVSGLENRLSQGDQFREFQAVVTAHETEFRKDHPDYTEAVSFLSEVRSQELAILGLTPPQIQNQIAVEAQQLAAAAMQDNRNPGEVAYKLAEQRGYKKAEEQPAAENQNGAAKPDPGEKLDTIERGERAAASLSGAPGAPSPKTTLDAIMDMDDDEFSQVTENDWRKIWQ